MNSQVKTMLNLKTWLLFITIVLLAVFPLAGGKFGTHLLTTYLIFSLTALSLDLIWGYTGILSIGHFAFFGIGAYSTALILTHVDAGLLSLALGALTGIVLSFLFGFVVAFVFFSLKLGELFVLVTISLAIIFEKIAVNQTNTLGGINGITLPYWVVPENKPLFYYLVLAIVAISYLLLRQVVSSPFGKVLLAIKDSETRAEYLGYEPRMFKTVVFALSAAVAALGGVLYAIYTGFVSPPLLGFTMSFDAVIWTALGGLGTLLGPIVGTFAVGFAQFYISGILLDYWILVIGLLFIIVVLFFPGGLARLGQVLLTRLHRPRRSGTAPPSPPMGCREGRAGHD